MNPRKRPDPNADGAAKAEPQELGYYAKEGLDIESVTYKDGPMALMGLLNGHAQFCLIGFEPVLMASEKGQESKVLLTTLFSDHSFNLFDTFYFSIIMVRNLTFTAVHS